MVERVNPRIAHRDMSLSGVVHYGNGEYQPLCRKHGTKYPVLVTAVVDGVTCLRCKAAIEDGYHE